MFTVKTTWALVALLLAGCGTATDRALERTRQRVLFSPDRGQQIPPRVNPPLPTLDEQATVEDYVSWGLRQNQDLRAAFEDWRAAVQRVPQVSSLPDPRFTFGHFLESVQTRTGPQLNRFGISQALPWFGVLAARGDAAAKDAEAVWWRAVALRRGVERQIRRAFFDYGWLARRIGIARDNFELLTQLEPVVQRRIQGGAAASALLQLQVEIGKVEDQVAGLLSFRPALSARLRALLHRAGDEPLPFPVLEEPAIEPVDPDHARKELAAANPELKELIERVAAASFRQDQAFAEQGPTITLGAEYLDTGDALAPGTPGSGDDPVILSLGFNLPLARNRYRAMEEEAERRIAAARHRLLARQDDLEARLMMVLYELDEAARQVVLYRDTLLPTARQSLRVTEPDYRGGRASLLDLLDRQRVLLVFEEAYWRACAGYGKARADLQALTGGAL